ncbi:MAG: hypothetical protein Kow00127_16320 [Bacteroidales bacterium]
MPGIISAQKAEVIEDFETGDFSQFEWQLTGDADWFVTYSNPYEGTYCAGSGDIDDGEATALELQYEVYAEDTLAFWYRVSSESNWDYLRFYVDGNEIESWSGEVPWSLFETVIPVGSHTFKWEYDKDFSVSSGADACWIDFIKFPPMEIDAFFTVDTNVICQGDVVHFYDQSIGPVVSWNWTFEGAQPTNSTQQNPVAGYPNVGSFDVLLEVSDGIETDTYYAADFIQVNKVPQSANTPSGISLLCASWGNSTYSTTSVPGVESYHWKITPDSAGTISGNGSLNITVVWEPDFLGTADLQVAGVNYCGIGVYSDPLTITRYLPEVTCILPAYVAISEPPFELTGGSPPGGTYSGPGVSNGFFDPAAAGLGAHTITYTYTDVNFCTNSATDVITVTQYTGYSEEEMASGLQIFPNPATSFVSVKTADNTAKKASVKILNAMGEVVLDAGSHILSGQPLVINVAELPAGVYFMKISADDREIVRKIMLGK